MKSFYVFGALALLLASASAQAQTTYTFSRAVGTGSVIGSITTDGTIGTLVTGNITGFSFTLNDGRQPAVTFTSADGVASVQGNGLSATTSDLFFDYSASRTNVSFNSRPAMTANSYCIGVDSCGVGTPAEVLQVRGGTREFTPQTGVMQIAAAAPEPATWGLMILGFGIVGAAARRRVRVKTVTYA